MSRYLGKHILNPCSNNGQSANIRETLFSRYPEAKVEYEKQQNKIDKEGYATVVRDRISPLRSLIVQIFESIDQEALLKLLTKLKVVDDLKIFHLVLSFHGIPKPLIVTFVIHKGEVIHESEFKSEQNEISIREELRSVRDNILNELNIREELTKELTKRRSTKTA